MPKIIFSVLGMYISKPDGNDSDFEVIKTMLDVVLKDFFSKPELGMPLFQLFDQIKTAVALASSESRIKARTKFMIKDVIEDYAKLRESKKNEKMKESSGNGSIGGEAASKGPAGGAGFAKVGAYAPRRS